MAEKIKYRLFLIGIITVVALDTYLTTIGW